MRTWKHQEAPAGTEFITMPCSKLNNYEIDCPVCTFGTVTACNEVMDIADGEHILCMDCFHAFAVEPALKK